MRFRVDYDLETGEDVVCQHAHISEGVWHFERGEVGIDMTVAAARVLRVHRIDKGEEPTASR